MKFGHAFASRRRRRFGALNGLIASVQMTPWRGVGGWGAPSA